MTQNQPPELPYDNKEADAGPDRYDDFGCIVCQLGAEQLRGLEFTNASRAVIFLYMAPFVVAFITYLAWFWLIHHYPASRLASFTFLTPLFGVLAGGMLLNEAIVRYYWRSFWLAQVFIW